MKTRWIVITIVLLLSLVATSSVSAGQSSKLPKWEVAFDAAQYGLGHTFSGAVFKNKMYFNFSAESGDQVWSTPDGKNWSLAWQASSVQEGYESIMSMTVFKNQLYLDLYDQGGEFPTRVMRTRDGKNWETVIIADTTETYFHEYTTFTTFNGAIYAGGLYCTSLPEDYCENFLIRSTSGDPGTWEKVTQFLDVGIASFETFKGALYMSGEGERVQIWRSFDGVNWEPVITDGFGEATNDRSGGFGVLGGFLYLGTGLSDPNGGDIWRTRDGVNWEPVTLNGFGDPNNAAFAGFVTHKGLLYTYSASETGCQVFSSKDGVHWKPANKPGWEDPNKVAVYREFGRVIFKGKLYMGTFWAGSVMKLVMP